MKTQKQINKSWSEDDIKRLPLSLLMILKVFIEKDRPYIDTAELQKELKVDGKSFGAKMASFSKYSKEPLIFPALKINQRETRWAINQEYLLMIKKVIGEIKQYLK